jgi:hypothetical protein
MSGLDWLQERRRATRVASLLQTGMSWRAARAAGTLRAFGKACVACERCGGAGAAWAGRVMGVTGAYRPGGRRRRATNVEAHAGLTNADHADRETNVARVGACWGNTRNAGQCSGAQILNGLQINLTVNLAVWNASSPYSHLCRSLSCGAAPSISHYGLPHRFEFAMDSVRAS